MNRVICISVAAVIFWGSAARANLVVNGGFETGDWTGWTATESVPDQEFTADNGGFTTIEVTPGYWSNTINGGTPWDTPYAGTYCAVFGGFSTYTNGSGTYTDPVGDTLTQTITTAAGVPYTLSFYVDDNNNYPALITASVNGNTILSLSWTDVGSKGWLQYSGNFVGTGSDTIQFAGWGPNSFTGLDNVDVEQAPVPEPVTMTSLFLALGGLGAWVRRRAKTQA